MEEFKLVVFDWHGVLYVQADNQSDYELVKLIEDIWMFSNIDVAIWTSAWSKKNIQAIRRLFGQNTERLKFIWLRDRTRRDPNFPNSYRTIKLLDDIIENAVINKDNHYTHDNVLIVDDSDEKLRFNVENSRFIWKGDEKYACLRERLNIL